MQQKPREGAPGVQLGGEPGEPTTKSQNLGISNSASSQNLPLDPIEVFAPADGSERALRIRIHKARDVAQARAARSKHGRARTLFWLAAQMAGDWVFARAPEDELKEVLDGLARLFLTAGMVERLEAPDEGR